MTYQLIFSEPPVDSQPSTKAAGENVFFADLPSDSKVYLFYYPGEMGNETLEDRLRALGEKTGGNLFVNIGEINDSDYDKIAKFFRIENLPAIIITANKALASPAEDFMTTFVRLDNEFLLKKPDRTIRCVEILFNLFIQGKVSEAMSKANWQQRTELINVLMDFFTTSLNSLIDFIAKRDISISLFEGKFELKQTGD